MEVNQQEKLRK